VFTLDLRDLCDQDVDRIKNLFGASKNKTNEDLEDQLADLNSTLFNSPDYKSLSIQIDYSISKGQKPMNTADKVESKKRWACLLILIHLVTGVYRLKDLELAEAKKKKREEARNGLEGYIYKIRDLVDSAAFVEASTDNERSKLKQQLEENSDWMWSEGEAAATKDLRSKKTNLE